MREANPPSCSGRPKPPNFFGHVSGGDCAASDVCFEGRQKRSALKDQALFPQLQNLDHRLGA